MKKRLLGMLICTSCLPEEIELNGNITDEEEGDILHGELTCPQCGRVFSIQNGIAFLDPSARNTSSHPESKYETAPALGSYMWSHYGDLAGEDNASDAYERWAELVHPHPGVTVDAGSAVGRFTFEMSEKSDLVIGMDTSLLFIRSARELMKKRHMTVHLQHEGRITRNMRVELPENWKSDKVEFIVADAQALPLKSGTVSSFASLNVIDKVPLPLKHLQEMNRIMKETGAQFLFSDPFSWSPEAAAEEDWLGGKQYGRYQGAGMDNIVSMLEREDGLPPRWNIESRGSIWWKLRTHANHYELIRSCYVKAGR